ncbi:MAG TPA: hypothetical protein VF260_07365 [Bacilli bacterium]
MNSLMLLRMLAWFAGALMYLLLFYICFRLFIAWLPWRSFRVFRPLAPMREMQVPRALARLLFIPVRAEKREWKKQLLKNSGIRTPYIVYETMRRIVGAAAAILGGLFWLTFRLRLEPLGVYWCLPAVLAFCVPVVLVFDKFVLQTLKVKRQQAVVKEIFAVSKQLLYFSGTGKNLHYQLTRCLPLTRHIRHELYLLTTEWYQDAGNAISAFKERIATDEGNSFAETLDSIRRHHHHNYYELLRNRIRDYKEQMDLLREGRKEMTSYVLFVLAGLPILNTFRVFIYPWVSEGRKLFDSLS